MRHPTIEAVQVLRGVAALAVAFLHAAHEAEPLDPGGEGLARITLLPWAAGVDVFFVISGLVMVYSSGALFGAGGGWRVFLGRRVVRVVPMYWGMTTLAVAAGLAFAGALSGDTWDFPYVLASYLFLPYERPDGFIQPVLRVGWTLNYEMAFYVVFALFVAWRPRRAVAGVVASIAGLVVAGAALRPAAPALRFWTDPVIAEFAFGSLLGLLLLEGVRLPGAARAVLLAGALALAAVRGPAAETPGQHPLLALLLVAGAAFGPAARPRGWATRWAVALGEGSYALYLVHPFAMRGLQLLAVRLGVRGAAGEGATVAAVLLSSVAAALILHCVVERPATAWLRRLATPRAVSGATSARGAGGDGCGGGCRGCS